MMIQSPYSPEWMVYPHVPQEHRWIFNKLELCYRLNIPAFPVGIILDPGEYCTRPVMNIQGMAKGGFKKVILTEKGIITEPVGGVVTLWNNGPRSWHQYVNDKWHNGHIQIDKEGELTWYKETKVGPPLPDVLCGISRYMLVERLGDEIIDVGPRHMVEQYRNSVVEDYRQFDPNYEVPTWCEYGFRPVLRTYEKDGWFHHEEVEGYNDRPSSGFE